jgi:hypothetical protein
MKNAPRPYDDMIDSRDLIELSEEQESDLQATFDEWIDELVEEAREANKEGGLPFDEDEFRDKQMTFEAWLEENGEDSDVEEYVELKRFIDEIRDCSGDSPEDGAQLIAESYFEKYAEQLADDVFGIRNASAWPFCHIDWDAAADALKTDYSEATWDGNTFLVRS